MARRGRIRKITETAVSDEEKDFLGNSIEGGKNAATAKPTTTKKGDNSHVYGSE